MYICPVPGPGPGTEISGEMTQTWPFRETWEEGAQEDGESGFGEFAPYQADKSTMSKRQAANREPAGLHLQPGEPELV